MIFTGLVSFLISASAFIAGIYIFIKREKNDKSMLAYSFFLISTGGLWLFVGASLFSSWMGKKNLASAFFFVDQLFMFFSGPCLAYYLSLKIWRNKVLAAVVAAFYGLAAAWGIFFLFKFGIVVGEATYFANKFVPNPMSFRLFLALIVPLVLFSFWDSLRLVLKRIIKKEKMDIYNFLYSFIIFSYLFLGIFDEQGLIAGWPLVFFRLIFASVFLSAYLTFYLQHSQSGFLSADYGEK